MNTNSPARPTTTKADPYRAHALFVGFMVAVTMPAMVVLAAIGRPPKAANAWVDAAERLGVSVIEIADGASTFRASCALCHGADGQGVPRLGKPLRNSGYVQSHSDAQLVTLIVQGRLPSDAENTTGVPMPPRAGNPMLSEDRVRSVVTYLRSIQEPGAPLASTEAWIAPPMAATAAGGGVGHDVFISSCSACHGPSGEGMEGLGKPLAESPFVDAKSDEELIAFVKQGRPIWDPENTTGVDMPPKGGNPALSDDDLKNIVAYIRSLHDANGAR